MLLFLHRPLSQFFDFQWWITNCHKVKLHSWMHFHSRGKPLHNKFSTSQSRETYFPISQRAAKLLWSVKVNQSAAGAHSCRFSLPNHLSENSARGARDPLFSLAGALAERTNKTQLSRRRCRRADEKRHWKQSVLSDAERDAWRKHFSPPPVFCN